MAACTACGHSLIGLPGAPAEQIGVLTADVRCPECGATSRAGVRILVGGSTALAMIRARPLRQRILLSIAFGSGIATVLLHILAVGALWFVIGALVDLAAGGRRFTSPRMLVVLAPCVAVLVAVARFWWKRPPAPHDPDKPAHERDRLLVIGPDGLETRKRRLEPSAVRTIRVAECIGAGDGAVVAAIRPIPMHESRWAPPADELYMAIPAGSAAALATGWFDDARMALGGMSAGGMATLIRLCRAHSFRAACVECTTGSFAWQRNRAMFEPQRAARLDPIQHLDAWRPIPLLILHNTLDAWVAVEGQREFIEALRARGLANEVVMQEYGETGAPHEHSGFGKFAADAKDRQTEFLVRHLRDC